jgi:hypothetical protein
MSDCFRFTLDYAHADPSLPRTLVGKFAAADPTSKATASEYGFYATEIGFYADLAARVPARVPRPIYAEIDSSGVDFTLIMDDAAGARSVDQIEGCSLDDAAAAVREVAKLHGHGWNDGSLKKIGWLAARDVAQGRIIKLFPDLFAGFLDRYRDMLEPEYQVMVRRVLPVYARMQDDTRSIKTLQHMDYRLDNLLFGAPDDPNAVCILDWGSVMLGSGLTDVAFFVGSSLDIEEQRRSAKELVRIYYDSLSQFDLGGYTWDDCWADYRRFSFQGMQTGIVAPMIVERSERSDKLFLQMVRNFTNQVRMFDSLSFWE